jgi:AraC-like DNA-binding protein
LAEQDLTAEGEYERFFSEQADVYRAELLFRERTVKRLSDQLRADGMFERLMKRAVLKNATLERGSVEGSRDGDVSEDGLWTWYFQSVLNVDRPPDLARCALELGFEDLPSFYRAVRREWTFRKTKGVDGLMNATQTHAVPEDPA